MPNISFTMLILTSIPKIAYNAICPNENRPPVKSIIILNIDHPSVDLR